ncbi:MAG: LysE family transporter [Acidaminococcaceae bacterium]|nr:LysE family transporter [Acidaminococcaceae bacterium]
MDFFIQGVVLGFSIAAPVGPIGVLCIRRTLTHGMLSGLISGLGAATADAVYGFIAVFGVSAVSVLLLDYQTNLRFVGGLYLLYIGYKTFKATPRTNHLEEKAKNEGLLKAYASTLFLTITNPLTILSFAAIFMGLGLSMKGVNYISAFSLVVGVFIGSMLWWLSLSGILSVLRHNFSQRRLKLVNKISGFIIVGFGIFSLAST